MSRPRCRTLCRFFLLAGAAGGWWLAMAAEGPAGGEDGVRIVPALEETFQNNQRAWP